MSQARKEEETEDRKLGRNKLKELGHLESKTNNLIKTFFLLGGYHALTTELIYPRNKTHMLDFIKI
jgi:hypothetical protein